MLSKSKINGSRFAVQKKKEADRRRYEMQRRQELEYMYPEYFTSFEYNNTYDDYYYSK